jgi:hypothetical protein
MAWVATAAIGSALIGGGISYLGGKADRKAINKANAQNNQYLNATMPYVRENLDRVSSDYQGMRDRGPYTGEYFAGPNAMQLEGNQALYDYGVRNRGLGQSLMDRTGGFVDNQNNLFNAYSGMVDRPDMMASADQFARDNMSPIVRAMMRDDTRRLEEQTLPRINTAASGSGNVNSSRAGVASALAERAYGDRLADVSSNVYNNLRDASLRQGNTEFDQSLRALAGAGNANNNLGRTFALGDTMFGSAVNNSLTAGNNQNTWDQNRLNADRDQYDYETGYQYNLGKDYGGFLADGSPGQGNYKVNNVSPWAAAAGGAMSGFGFGNQLGGQFFGGGGFGGPMSYPTGGTGNFGGGMGMWT